MVGDHAVVFLRHAPIETPESGFDVDEGDLGRIGSECTRGHGVRVTLHNYSEGTILREQFVETGRGPTDLGSPPLRADAHVHVGAWHAELVEEDPGEFGVVVLTRVDDARRVAKESNGAGEFDDLGARAEDNGDRTIGE